MNVLLDSNIVLDHILNRVPFADNATDIISLAKQGKFAAGENIQALYIITRDINGFSASVIPALSPEKFIDMITVD